jgi:AraC-like DNA-binding protein
MKSNKNLHIFRCGGTSLTSDGSVHTHEFIEIVYVLSGEMVHEIDGCRYNTARGDMLFMNYGCTHTFSSESAYTYVNILFSPELMADAVITTQNAFSVLSLSAFNEMRSAQDSGCVRFFGKERDEIETLIFSMLEEYEKKQTSWETVLGNLLTNLIIKMLRKTELGIGKSEMDGIWQSLSEYIDQNLDSRLTLAALAEKCFYNPSYFSRIFKEKFGVSLTEYITRRRLSHAITLLSESVLSVEEIGERVGFPDKSSLYHAFSRYLGTTPGEYRRGR